MIVVPKVSQQETSSLLRHRATPLSSCSKEYLLHAGSEAGGARAAATPGTGRRSTGGSSAAAGRAQGSSPGKQHDSDIVACMPHYEDLMRPWVESRGLAGIQTGVLADKIRAIDTCFPVSGVFGETTLAQG